MNEAGMFSSITPTLAGDIKSGHNSFLTEPVSVEDLHASRAGRNFWVSVAGRTPWSAAGNGVTQIARRGTESGDTVTVEAGFLWHRVIRANAERGLRAEVTNFVPIGPDKVELMQVTPHQHRPGRHHRHAHGGHPPLRALRGQPAGSPPRHLPAPPHPHGSPRRHRHAHPLL